ncbi:MAG TPA: hypothetical protein VGE54_10405 [Brevundimonas sp.]
MTYTYSDDLKPHSTTATTEPVFTPVYARKTGGKKAVKTWMILAPVGALALAAGAVTMLMNPKEAAPFAEPAAPTSSLSTAAPVSTPAAPAEAAPLVIENATVEPAAAPVVRTQRQTAPAPAARRAAPAQAIPAAEPTPAPTGPQPYTGNLNTAPATPTTTTPTTPPPVVVIQPQG